MVGVQQVWRYHGLQVHGSFRRGFPDYFRYTEYEFDVCLFQLLGRYLHWSSNFPRDSAHRVVQPSILLAIRSVFGETHDLSTALRSEVCCWDELVQLLRSVG